jgi:hypothetical protein
VKAREGVPAAQSRRAGGLPAGGVEGIFGGHSWLADGIPGRRSSPSGMCQECQGCARKVKGTSRKEATAPRNRRNRPEIVKESSRNRPGNARFLVFSGLLDHQIRYSLDRWTFTFWSLQKMRCSQLQGAVARSILVRSPHARTKTVPASLSHTHARRAWRAAWTLLPPHRPPKRAPRQSRRRFLAVGGVGIRSRPLTCREVS